MPKLDINHEVGIQAPAKEIYRALTEPKRLAQWWTSDTRGSGTKVGERLEFWFGDFCQPFEVVELVPNERVRWKADAKGMEEWVGTEITFSLESDPDDKDQCWVHFKHSGFASDQGCLPHCSTKWAVFMVSLKELMETGKGRPAPDDIQINHN